MKNKFPHLEQLRSQRLMRENETIQPYKSELKFITEIAASLKRKLRNIEETMANDMAKNIPEIIERELSYKLMDTIIKAASNSHNPNSFIIELPKIVAFGNPRSVEAEALRYYKNNCLPKLALNVGELPIDNVTFIEVKVPELAIRLTINK